MPDVIQIRSISKRNVVVSAFSGVVGLCFGTLLLMWLPKNYYLAGIFMISLALVMSLIAWVKYREPTYSFILTKNEIIYQCRHGKWQLNWANIQRIDIPKASVQGINQDLEMIAVKLKDYTNFLDTVSPRLMSNILMQQRPLLSHELSAKDNSSCSTGQCLGDDLLEDDYYKMSNGAEYHGMQAMFANRMVKLRERLGYDIFVAASELDRTEQEFVTLLKQCQQQVVATTQ